MTKKFCAAVLLSQLLCGCSFLTGLLHMEAVEIVGWSPNRQWVNAQQVSCVSITFSSPMNRAHGENAFSLSRDNGRLRGHFSWEEQDTLLVFFPEIPFADGHSYTLKVAESAEDVYGNSLVEPFSFTFTTAEEQNPPKILAHEPEDGAQVMSIREQIRILFSEPVDEASFYLGFSIFPSVYGGYQWSSEGEEVEFTPLADYRSGQNYEVVVGREITDKSGNQLAEELRFNFQTCDTLAAMIDTVETLADGKDLIPLQLGGGIDPSLEIEKDEQFLFTFSQGPTEEQKADLFRIDPVVPYSLTWKGENRSCILAFEEALIWNRVYQINLLGLTYTFVVSGPQSLPIIINNVTYCPDLDAPPGVDKFVVLGFADNVDFSSAVKPAFDFQFDHAIGVQVDIGSFLQALDITIVPACVSVSPRDVELSPLSIDPYSVPGAGQSVARLHCSIADDPTETGTITFRLSTVLRDTAGNHLSEEFVLLINNN